MRSPKAAAILSSGAITPERPDRPAGFHVCFVGSRRYDIPLDVTTETKFRVLAPLGDLRVVALSSTVRPTSFLRHARFYLLPAPAHRLLRYAGLYSIGFLVLLALTRRKETTVIVAQSPYDAVPAVLAKRVARWFRRRVRLIVESHGDFEDSVFVYRKLPRSPLYRRLLRGVARWTLRHADALRAVSDSTREQLQNLAPARPVVQFPTWTNLSVFFAAGSGDRLAVSEPTIVFAGLVTHLKGVHVLVEAFGKIATDVPDARLELFGSLKDRPYVAALRERVRALDVEARVRFAGEVAQAELAERIASADVLVLPSFSEGLGRVLLEGMACGVPVVATRVGGLPELVRDGVNGLLVAPGDSDLLAFALKRVLQDRDAARRMGREGRELVRFLWSEESYRASYARLFEAAVRGE